MVYFVDTEKLNELMSNYVLLVHQVIFFVKEDKQKLYVPNHSIENSGPT